MLSQFSQECIDAKVPGRPQLDVSSEDLVEVCLFFGSIGVGREMCPPLESRGLGLWVRRQTEWLVDKLVVGQLPQHLRQPRGSGPWRSRHHDRILNVTTTHGMADEVERSAL